MKQTERKTKLASLIIIALMLSTVFSGVVMVMANVNISLNTSINATTATNGATPADTAPPIRNESTPTGDRASVNASVQDTSREVVNGTSVEDASPTIFLPVNSTYNVTINEEAFDSAGNSLESAHSCEFTNESQPLPPQAPLLISNIAAINITTNSTTITWLTNPHSDSWVKYGTETGNYTSFAYDSSSVTEHSIELSGLLPNTAYYYVVNSTSNDHHNESTECCFTTLPESEGMVEDTFPPAIAFAAPALSNNTIENESNAIINISEAPASGDWVVSGTESYSDEEIILHGNLNILSDASLTLTNVTLIMNGTADGQRTITIQQWGSLYTTGSNITGNYYYNFRNYGYLNMQNCSVNKANSIYFYDSSDDSSVIGNSTIMNTASYGIYTNYAAPTIINNTISSSGSYGIYAYYASPNIINNNISGSGSSGIYAYYASPNIFNNSISGSNGYGIYTYYHSSPTIRGNTISDSSSYGIYSRDSSSPTIENNTIKNNNGGIYIYRYSSSTIINTIIDENGQYGVNAVSSYTIEIIGCTITNQTYGIRTDSQSVTVENSSICSTSYDYYLSGSAYLKSGNSSFNKSRVYVSGGVLDVYWHDTVTVEYDHLPVNNSVVEVFDNANSIVTSGVTDDSGQVLLAIKEFTQGPATMLNYTPHILKATKSGYQNGSIQSNVTCTKSDTIVLGEEVYIPGQPIVIFGDWIINDSVSYSNKTLIVDNGNVIVENGGSLSLNNTLLQLRYTTTGYRIEIQDGGNLYLYDSDVTASYPELDLYYNFRNYGYLNMQNCSVNKANSIYFYDSSDDSSVICNSTIMNTASYGVYASQASPAIINNTISSSGSYGIYAYYASPNIINNNISGSGSSGIYAYYASPNIFNNSISGSNGYGIYTYYHSSPTIRGNTISDSSSYGIYSRDSSSPTIENNTIKNNNGGIYIYRYSSSTIINTIIDENGQYGVNAVSSYTIEIIGCTITNQTYGIRTDSQSVTVENSSICSTSYDYYLSGSAYLKSGNSSFNKSRVYVSGGVLDVYWHDTVTVEYDHLPVNNSVVEVFDNANSIVTSGVTDDSGQVLLAIKEFTQGPATMLNYTPHILKATKSGYQNGSIQSNVTCTKSDTIVLGEEVYIPGQPIVIFGDWIINDSVSYSNKTLIVDNGNVIVENGGSLSLNNTLLQLRYTTTGYRIEIQDGGNLYLYDSDVTASYPELDLYYNFRNYGYLNMQNCSVNKANSIYFYDSSDDSSVICNSTIMNTASYGVYASQASPAIINNTISSSGSYGIYAYYASPNIINNNISGSGSSGIYAYYASPNIFNNSISGSNGYGIYTYYHSSPTIRGNTISDSSSYGIYSRDSSSPTIENNTIKNNNGGIYIYRYSSSTIINTIIDENGQYGVNAVSSYTIEIIGCTITNQTYGIRTDSQSVTVENSSICSTSYDYYLSGSAYLKSGNSSFNKSRVYVSGGVLDVYWHDTVTVEYDHLPVNNSVVEVFDNANSIVTSGVTDDSGQVLLAIKEFTQGPATMLNYTPHILKATKSGYQNGSIQSNVTCTKSDTIVLGEEVYIPGQPIVIFGDWIINDSVSYSNKTLIVDNGNVIVENGGSLSLNNTLLQLRYTTTGYRIEIQDGGNLYLYDSDVTASYPELDLYYNFRNYGYLNMQNCSVNKANSIYFYDSSDDSSVICNSTIMNTASYGVYASQASPAIINNTISSSGSYGIYAYYASPNIINNNISGSGSSGIYAYYASPNIFNNSISGSNGYGIYTYYHSSPTIRGNTISDSSSYGIYSRDSSSPTIENNTIKNNNGGIYIYRYSSSTIINTIIDENGQYGVNAVSSYTIEIIGCTITNQTYGIRTDSQSVTVENSSICSTSYDYYLSGSAYLKSGNSSFNKSRVYVSGGVLDVYWHDTVTVEYDHLPVNNSVVEVFDNANSIVTSGVTDDSGQVLLAIKEFTQGPATMLNYTPHILKATKSGYQNGSIQSNVTCTKSDTIVLGEEVYIPGQPIVIFGDWIINDSVSYSNKTLIVDNGNVIVENGGSLSLNNTLLQLRYTTTGYRIEIQDGGNLYLYDSDVTASYPELDLYYNFRNYGYLNMQNCSVNKANSIYFYDSSDDSSVICNSTIMNTASYGIYADHASPTIQNNFILRSGSYGISISYSSANISGNFLKYTGGGIRTYYSDITVSDTTIIHSTSNHDYYIYWGSVKSINTSFDESKVYFYGSGSVLDYSWYLDVKVRDANTNPIADANVSVKDSAGLQIFNGATDAEGWVRNIVATEYRQTSAGKTYYNPYNISAEFNGTSNYVTSNIDTNKEVTVFLAVNQPLKITILAPANNSVFVQGDQIAFKAIGFDPLDGILTGSAINWTSSIDGFIGSGESFSNSNLSTGVHQITAEATNSGGSSVTDSVSIELIGRADLTVENINGTPTKINEGEIVLFNASVRNVGDGYTPAPFYVRFYIDDDYLGQTQIARLNASELRIVTQTWLATASARNVTVVADYYNSIQETDELNNRLTAPLTEIDQSDLTVSELSYTPDIFYDGMTVTFDAKIRNIGVSNANKSFEVGFYVNGTKIGTGSVNSLAAGASINVSSNWTAVPGSYDLSVKADDTNKIFESNESNNIMILNLPVVEQSDLTVSNLTWTPSNFTDGQVVTFDAVIANIGVGNTTTDFYTRFLIDDVNIGEESVAGLDAGNSTSVTQTWTATSGEHTLKAVVDAYDAVVESNETNNWLSKNLSQVQSVYLLFLSSNAGSYTEGDNATFSAKASRKSSPDVYLSDTEVNLTLAILAENGSVIFTSPMSYANTVFSVNVSLTSFSNGNYTARVTLKDTESVTVEESLSFRILANFSVAVSTNKIIYDRDEIVHITGNAQYTDGSPVSNAPVILNIHVKGYTRSYSLVTGTAGNFSHYYNPSFMEAGNVTAEASVASETLQRSAQTPYTMYGLYMNPSGIINCWMSKNSSENLTFSLRNYGESDLNGIAVNIIDEDTGDGVDTVLLQPPAATLMPDEEQEFTLNLIAGNVATSHANFSVSVTSTEGSMEEADLFIHLVDAVPIAIVNPTAIEAGMNPDDLLVRTVNITNSGYESMNDVNISLPSLDWISVTATDLGSIAPGTGKSFDIILHPANDTAPSVYQDTLTISSSNHQPVNIYLSITVTSSQQGDLMFHVINDIGENISGASIVIQNQDVLTQIYQGTTNETGYYLFDLISTGRYNFIVQASRHTSVSNSALVAPGVQTLVEPVLPKSILGVQLTVTQIQIGDEYDIVLNLTFETEVPPPILIPKPLYIRHRVNFTDPVYDTDGAITISNPGLISIFNVTVDSSLLTDVDITFPTGEAFFVGELKANSSVTIPYHLHVTSVSCDSDHYRNSIRLQGDYIYFEEYSDVTHNVYLTSEIPVFVNMYDCPYGDGYPIDTILDYFNFSYLLPEGRYKPLPPGPPPPPKRIPPVETVHERVKFSISQDATLERDAFAAGLELTNKLTDENIEGVKVVIDITDELGSDAADMFFVNQTFMININAIDGTGVINPAAVANIDWLLVPKPGAGGTDPAGQDYSVQAFIDYTVDGAAFSVNSTEVRINVMPQPLLNLTYMVPRAVKADTPFNIVLNVTNVGYGAARNLKLDSAQPMIYEDQAGLLVAFELIGSGIVGEAESDSMLIKFGDIAPGESKTGYWIMTASLDGEFTEFKGSFSHSNALGGDETSLIRNITYVITQFTAEIISPEDDAIYNDSEPISFAGTAYNGAGPLTYEWKTSITGHLSNDPSFSTLLNEGLYNVILKVTDKNGITDTDTHTIRVVNMTTHTVGELKTVVLFYEGNQFPSTTSTFDNIQTYLTINKPYTIGISTFEEILEISNMKVMIYNSRDELKHSKELNAISNKEASVTYINSTDYFAIPDIGIGSDYYMVIEVGTFQKMIPLYLSPFEIRLVKEDMSDFSTDNLEDFLSEIKNYNGMKYYNIVPYNWEKNGNLVIIANPVYEQKYIVNYYKKTNNNIKNEELDAKITGSLLRFQFTGLSEIARKYPQAKIIVLKGDSRDSNYIERIINDYRDSGKKVMIVGALPHEQISFNNFISTKAYKASYISYVMANQVNNQTVWSGEDKVFTANHFRANQYFNALNSLDKYNKEIYGSKENNYPAILIAKKNKPLLQISPTLGKNLKEDINDVSNETLYKVGTLRPIGHTYYLGLSAENTLIGGFEIGQSHTSFTLGPDFGPIGACVKGETNKFEDQVDMDLFVRILTWDRQLLGTPKTINVNENLDYEKIQMERNNLNEGLKKEIPLYLKAPCLGDTIGDTRIPTGQLLTPCSPFTIKDVLMPWYDFQLFFNTPHAFISEHETLQYALEPSSSHTILSDSLKKIGTKDRPISETIIYQNMNYPSSVQSYNFVNSAFTGAFEIVGTISWILSAGWVDINPTYTGTPHDYNYVGSKDNINAILINDDLLPTIITDSIKYSNDKIVKDELKTLESVLKILDKSANINLVESDLILRTFDVSKSLFNDGDSIPVSHLSGGQLSFPWYMSKSVSLDIKPNSLLDSSPDIVERNHQIVQKITETDIKDLSIKSNEYISLDTTKTQEFHYQVTKTNLNKILKVVTVGIKTFTAVYGSVMQYTAAQEVATFNANQLYYIGNPYLTGYDDPIYNENITELPKNVEIEISSEPFNVSFLNTTFIYPNVTHFEMPNITAQIIVEDWLPFTGAPQTPVFIISILHPSNQVIDSIDYNLYNEIKLSNVTLPMGALKVSEETIPGVLEDYSEFPPYKIMSGSEKSGNVTHTVLKVFPTTYFPNRTLVYYKNISINLGVSNITTKDVEVHLQPYPNILAIPEKSEANISLKVYNDLYSKQNATVDVIFYPPNDLTFTGSNITVELGTSTEDYYRILSYSITVPAVDRKRNFLLNITLKYDNGMEIVYKNYSIPVVVIDENFTDLEIFDVSIPDRMTTMQNYNISAKVKNAGDSTVIQLPVKIFLDSEIVALTIIPEIKPNEIITTNFTYTPAYASIHNITAAISAAPYEVKLENNIYTKEVYINARPIACFTYTRENPADQTIIFNASTSYDPDGTITNYEWDFGDGNVTNTTEPTIRHSYASEGDYTVNLTITDNDGTKNKTTKLITVSSLCGDVAPCPDCDGTVDMGDVILLLNNVSYLENTRYTLGNAWAGDCRCTGVRDMGDVILLLNNVSYPEESRYVLDCCD